MATQIFVNLPVKDLGRTRTFFSSLGYRFNERFSDDKAICMIVSDDIYVMLLVESFFKTFTSKSICDATQSTEVIVCLSSGSRNEIDELVRKAVEAGASVPAPPRDYGFMYQHGFQDLDGHLWELAYMDPAAVNG